MFDFRIHTFLTLCQTKSYTKTAELLHITQPAVTGHIKHLENCYQVKLFSFTGKTLSLTPQGERLQQLATTMLSDFNKELEHIKHFDQNRIKIHFGATLTIGEYTMPPLLCKYLDQFPNSDIHMHVDNTTVLLRMLNEGLLDFALIEGSFNKSDYIYELFSEEPFIAVCSAFSPLAHQSLTLDELTQYPLIVREEGSGSRSIITDSLHAHNLSLQAFPRLIELGNLAAIKSLVIGNYGITFIYQEAIKKELQTGELAPIMIKGLTLNRAFHFICPKNSLFVSEYLNLFHLLKSYRQDG